MRTIAAVALLGQALSAPADVPLQPTGKWAVEYADAACILSRDYGDGAARVTLGLNPWPLGDKVEVATVSQGAATLYRSSKATLTLQPSGRAIKGSISLSDNKQSNRIVMALQTESEGAAELLRSVTLSIAPDHGRRMDFAVPGMKGAAVALKACQADLLKQWGIDSAERDRAPLPSPKTPLISWIGPDDYPSDAFDAHIQGSALIVWTIETDGTVADCRVVQSSGSASLDAAACRATVQRGRYVPPIGFDGKPTTLHGMRKVVWRLP